MRLVASEPTPADAARRYAKFGVPVFPWAGRKQPPVTRTPPGVVAVRNGVGSRASLSAGC